MQHVICVTDVLSLITLFIPLGESLNLVSPLTQPCGTLARFHKIHFKYPLGKESIKNVQKGEELTLVFGFTGELNNTGRYHPCPVVCTNLWKKNLVFYFFVLFYFPHNTNEWFTIHHLLLGENVSFPEHLTNAMKWNIAQSRIEVNCPLDGAILLQLAGQFII